MIGDRLLFLLRHEFRLWHRSPQSIRAVWPFYRVIWGLFLGVLLGVLVGAELNHFQLPQLHFSADSPPDITLWYAGGFVYLFSFISLLSFLFAGQRATVEQQAKNWLLFSPLPSRLTFANTVLHPILTGAVSMNFLLLIYSVPLLIIYQSPRLWIGMHLTATAWTMVSTSLQFWGLYAALKWGDRILWKLLKRTVLFGALGLFLFIIGLPLGIGGSVLPLDRVIEILVEQTQQGNLLGNDSWLWVPARSAFLDPLPSLIWTITGIGLPLLTIQVLHRPLSHDLQAALNSSQNAASAQKPLKPFKENLWHLLMGWNFKLLMAKIPSMPGLLTCILLLVSYGMCLSPPGTFQIDNAVTLAIASALIPALNTSILTHYSIAEDPMKDILRSSPIPPAKAKVYKRLAALIPIWISILPLIITVGISGKPWIWAAALGLAASTSHAFLRDWNACPVSLTEVFSTDSGIDALGCRDYTLMCIEAFSFLLWLSIAIFFLIHLIPVGMFFLSVESYILFCAYRRNRLLGDSWSV